MCYRVYNYVKIRYILTIAPKIGGKKWKYTWHDITFFKSIL